MSFDTIAVYHKIVTTFYNGEIPTSILLTKSFYKIAYLLVKNAIFFFRLK